MADFNENSERQWYVVQTYSGYENKVRANLEQRIATMGMDDRIFRVLVPVEERVYNKDGKIKRVRRITLKKRGTDFRAPFLCRFTFIPFVLPRGRRLGAVFKNY
jgi:transcription antitermination factor NusG